MSGRSRTGSGRRLKYLGVKALPGRFVLWRNDTACCGQCADPFWVQPENIGPTYTRKPFVSLDFCVHCNVFVHVGCEAFFRVPGFPRKIDALTVCVDCAVGTD